MTISGMCPGVWSLWQTLHSFEVEIFHLKMLVVFGNVLFKYRMTKLYMPRGSLLNILYQYLLNLKSAYSHIEDITSFWVVNLDILDNVSSQTTFQASRVELYMSY